MQALGTNSLVIFVQVESSRSNAERKCVLVLVALLILYNFPQHMSNFASPRAAMAHGAMRLVIENDVCLFLHFPAGKITGYALRSGF